MINNSLEKLLASKNILIVLDDLWEENKTHLEELQVMLKVGESGKVVVIATTRSEGIANKICTVQPHKLAPLTDDQCWNIIKQKSDIELRGGQEDLLHIGKEIASKCGGVPLAAQSVGHMLYSLPFNDWESVRNSDIWNLSDSEDVLASLKLSYSVMSSYLKLCFAYCAIFPKGYKIVKDDLIHQWISLGFIKAANKLSTWQLGEKYIRQLLGLSFLEHSKPELTTGVNFENNTMFIMHDLVHDLARLVMVDEILVAGKQGNTGGSCFHFALVDDSCQPLELSKIRALHFMACAEIDRHSAAFSCAKSMRVLHLSECSLHKLPDSIGVLTQLRYLNAPRVQDEKIPDSITKLSKLIYLNLHGSTKILVLPESIGEIKGLMYLDLSHCSGFTKLSESFGKLKDLVHLDLSGCYLIEGISVFLESFTQLWYLNLSYCKKTGEISEALGRLSELQYLNLSYNSYLGCCEEAEFLGSLTKLEYFNFSSYYSNFNLKKLPESLGRCTQLKYLNLSGSGHRTELPRLFGSIKNLVHLDLSCCSMLDCVGAALVGLNSLQYLNLKDTYVSFLPDDMTKLRYLNISGVKEKRAQFGQCSVKTLNSLINHICSNLLDLEHLDLSGNHRLTRIPESICSLTKLHTLKLSRCVYLKEIPESICTIGSLKFLYVEGCRSLSKIPQLGSSAISLPHFAVHAGNDESSSNLVMLQPIDSAELQITGLENVKSAGEAHRMKLMEKKLLEKLKLEWTQGVERFMDDKILLEKLVPPSTLTKLEIRGYNGVSFLAWLVGQLPNLSSLVLRDMTNMEEWNTSCSSGLEHVIQTVKIHGCHMLRIKGPLPKAKKWRIECSDNLLLSWDECTMSHTSASSSFSVVSTELSVEDCKVDLHRWRLLQHFPGLLSLSITNCGDLTGSPEITQHLSSLETLFLRDEHMEELPKWLGELTSLQNLQICGCHGVKELNENMKKLTKLESLQLDSCERISVPHWLGELISLKKLRIQKNSGLRSLPGSIQQLTSLQEIILFYCDALEHVVAEPEEGKMKLTPSQERVCPLPTSLRKLKLVGCSGIKSLPEGIQQLSNLQDLEISLCPGLKQWCELEENKMKLSHIENKTFY